MPLSYFLFRCVAGAVFLVAATGYHVIHDDGKCTCQNVEVVSSNPEVTRKHGGLLGTYRLRPDQPLHNRPSYAHVRSTGGGGNDSSDFFLFYNAHSQGFWAVGERVSADVVRLENQGDALCPYRMKSTWRFADGDLAALVYDLSLKVVCLDDPCSMAHCGHQARCIQEEGPGGKNVTKCECNPGFYGDPYDRCYPKESDDVSCQCRRLIFSSQNSVALAKHRNGYGEYFLYGEYEGSPVYQHFAGVEYLYKRDGNWLISDEVGLREAGLQNQGDVAECPYRFRTTWEYADIEQPGWQWVYDYSARLVCPTDPCSLTKCGFHASCVTADSDSGQVSCQCNQGYQGNAYIRCFPEISPTLTEEGGDCLCKELILSSLGASALAQADKMGEYFYFATYNGRPAYQHRSGLDYLYYAEGNAWVIGAEFGGSRVGVVNFDRGACPYRLRDQWKHSVSGQLRLDASLSVACRDDLGYGADGGATQEQGEQVWHELQLMKDRPDPVYKPQATQTEGVNASTSSTSSSATPTTTTPLPPTTSPTSSTTAAKAQTEGVAPLERENTQDSIERASNTSDQSITSTTKLTSTTTSTSTTPAGTSTTRAANISPKIPAEEEPQPVTVLPVAIVTPLTVATTSLVASDSSTSITSTGTTTIEETTTSATSTTSTTTTEDLTLNLPCPCEEIIVNSTHAPTIEKHGAQLGRYHLYDYRSERPVYKHVDREQYLYYHPYSGGNWLINYEIGLLYGGIQNSKDLPVCPYLINTVWQYGDSELGGWVYDPSLRVTCPTDPCSVLKCGFRAQCVQDDQGNAKCLCRKGFEGDPFIRCLPKAVDPRCTCRQLRFSSSGLARDHQRDKMGDFFLWGYYNGRPVYQHFSGLDFLYFHKNNVWGVGPKIGGNSAGLLNFGNLHCPYSLRTPWEFGTKDTVMRRQIDTSLRVECVDPQAPSKPPAPPGPPRRPPSPPSLQNSPPNHLVSYSSRTSSGGGVLPPLHQQILRGSIPRCGVRTILPDPERLLRAPGGDRRVEYGSFPWQARIALSERDPNSGAATLRHLCSGAVVSDRFVLTAASCLTSHPMFKYRVVSGDHSLDNGERDPREAVHAVQSIHVHDLYDELSEQHDLAMVKVRATAGGTGGYFDVGQFVMPACLPSPRSRYVKDMLCEVSSWRLSGGNSLLQAAAVPILRRDDGAGCGPGGQLCTGPAAGGGDFDCRLDPGSPLVCPTKRGVTLIGISSGATVDESGCYQKNKKLNRKYLRVSDYVDWIEDRLKL